MGGRVVVLRGDAAHLPLPDGSVDLIVTSPPYFAQRRYRDSGAAYDGQIGGEMTPERYIDALLACTREWVRVLQPRGSLFVNLGDKRSGSGGHGNSGLLSPKYKGNTQAAPPSGGKCYGYPPKTLLGLPWRYALRCMDELGLILRAEIIWDKTNARPETALDRASTSHEQMFHFVVQPWYFASTDEVRERGAGRSVNPLGRLPGTVWRIATAPLMVPPRIGIEHFAPFPCDLPRNAILGWSPVGAKVLDPCGGSGTVALVADSLGRTGITVDRSTDYCRLARWRTADPGERARALGVPKPPPVMDGQGDLFELGEAS